MGDIRADEPRLQESHSTEWEINWLKSMCLWVEETLKTMSHPPLREEMKEGREEERMEERDDRRSSSWHWQVEERRVFDYMQRHTGIHPHSDGQDFNDFYFNYLFSKTLCAAKCERRRLESLWNLPNFFYCAWIQHNKIIKSPKTR